MRRVSVLLPVFALVLAGSVVLGRAPSNAVAQDATPPGTPAAAPNLTVGQLAPIGQPFPFGPGVEVEFLNESQPAAAPGHSVVIYRVTVRGDEGGQVPSHIHPGSTSLVVESGSFSWTLLAGTVLVTRPGQAQEEVTAPGTELVLNPGEGLSYNEDVIHTAGPVGDEPGVVLAVALFTIGQTFVTVTNEQGTPAA